MSSNFNTRATDVAFDVLWLFPWHSTSSRLTNNERHYIQTQFKIAIFQSCSNSKLQNARPTFFKSRFRLVTSRSTPHKTIQKHGTGGTPVPSRKLQVQNTRSNGEIEMPKLTGKIDESTLSPQLNLKEPRERFELVSYMNVNLPTCTQKGLIAIRAQARPVQLPTAKQPPHNAAIAMADMLCNTKLDLQNKAERCHAENYQLKTGKLL